jgi:hypothetical protein
MTNLERLKVYWEVAVEVAVEADETAEAAYDAARVAGAAAWDDAENAESAYKAELKKQQENSDDY